MSVYKRSFIITAILTAISLVFAIFIHYITYENFWSGVLMGVFGSSLLSSITSLVGYFSERRKTMDGFFQESIRMVKYINRYQQNYSVDDKLLWMLGFMDYNDIGWDKHFGEMDYFDNSIRTYVFEKIYKPLHDLRVAVLSHDYQFRMHISGTGKNEGVMKAFINEIETYIFEITENRIRGSMMTSVKNKIVIQITDELMGKYYDYMYWKRKASLSRDEQKRNIET